MKWFINMKIGAKLILGFLFISILFAATGGFTLINILALDESDTELYEWYTVALADAATFNEHFHRMRSDLRDLVLAQTDESIQEFENRIVKRTACLKI